MGHAGNEMQMGSAGGLVGLSPLRDGVMSHNANANATFVTFWLGHQWEVLTHIYPIAANDAASN
jgi:hypothetical protein